mmetsp:Transcript_40024/g.127349  ORF Transcript_40024/g.127349 Transcript_40024/m.127349 type:complete len:130 (+) Transcript_40024:1271-1660(+)
MMRSARLHGPCRSSGIMRDVEVCRSPRAPLQIHLRRPVCCEIDCAAGVAGRPREVLLPDNRQSPLARGDTQHYRLCAIAEFEMLMHSRYLGGGNTLAQSLLRAEEQQGGTCNRRAEATDGLGLESGISY